MTAQLGKNTDAAVIAPTGAAPRFAAVIIDMDGVVTVTSFLASRGVTLVAGGPGDTATSNTRIVKAGETFDFAIPRPEPAAVDGWRGPAA